MKALTPLQRRFASIIVIIVLFSAAFLGAHWVDYTESGCTHFGGHAYEESGTGFFVPFNLEVSQFHKLSLASRTERPLKIETDFEFIRFSGNTPSVTSFTSVSRLFPVFLPSGMSCTHCDNFISTLYETNEKFRAIIKASIADGSIPIEDLLSSTSNCNLPVDDLTPGVLKVLALFRQHQNTNSSVEGVK